ncbi:amino acid-binding protein [Cronobacter turicensis]|uniref:Amino acid-binding protein n=2 Tax=Cronobacter turicensis TaxID=413502 RepID=A0A2T7AV19_9ENTR|nr:amino acid-binding protein [Cronobacter turicensis]MEB8541179.1 amino acid-binding protein [Cronobacter sakazakii]EKM0528759.1 amino acid-binding protein [Cronobacter turicensis]ELQ6001879.1 amino acid-binding protein [Cronobacter turicensis]ELQ6131136.1 amino acid-binding protein [Cronobacter turicensis]ELY3554106.1 amino acid-binding protein [Cronobacter turicensis]
MYDIHVILSNTPGALAALGTLLGKSGVGLEGGGVFSFAQESHAHFLVEDGETAQRVLQDAGFTVRHVARPLIRKLPQARPGELGEIARALADGGVNILVQYSDHANRLILVTDNHEQAEKVTRPWAVPDDIP